MGKETKGVEEKVKYWSISDNQHTHFADEKVELCKSQIMKPINTHTNPNLF